jgi:hypothetical protein
MALKEVFIITNSFLNPQWFKVQDSGFKVQEDTVLAEKPLHIRHGEERKNNMVISKERSD